MAYKNRLHRSELAVPGSNMRMIEKAPHAGADLVFLDLEDAVAVSDKEDARRNVIHALNDLDWSKCSVSVRINGLDSHFCYRDIVDVVEQAGDKLDTILVPKVGHPSDLQFVALMLGQIEAAKGFKPINLHALIETALGMANVEAIAQSCPDRLEALVFGVADYAASNSGQNHQHGRGESRLSRVSDPNDEGQRKTYLGNQWHFAMSRLIVACRAYGLRPIDGPFGDISDPDGYLAVAKSFAALGGEGKWAIHPSQIDLANQIFSPAEEEVEHARRVLDAMEKAAAEGMGAVSLDGRMIDAASIRQAEVVIEKMKQIESTATLKEAVA